MKVGTAFFAGVVGGVTMSLLMWMARLMGMEIDLSMMLGTMFIQPPGFSPWVLGFFMHLMISGLIALIYAWGFEHVTHRAGWTTGVLFSLLHSTIAGLVMGMVGAIHPLMPDPMPAPGFFLANRGALYPLMLFVLHGVYGAIVGRMYAPVRHQLAYDDLDSGRVA